MVLNCLACENDVGHAWLGRRLTLDLYCFFEE